MPAPSSTIAPILLKEFSRDEIAKVSARAGIYVLFRRGHVLVIGMSPNLRASLEGQKRGDGGARTLWATDFRVEEANLADLDNRQEELLNEYRRYHNYTVPVGNSRDVNRRLAAMEHSS